MCVFAWWQAPQPSAQAQKSSSVWMVDRKTHQLKKAKAKGGVPSYTHVGFPIEQTANYQARPDRAHQTQGCACGYTTRNHMTVTPTSIPDAKVGQDVTLRYDASEICQGQTITNLQNVNSPDPRNPDDPSLNLGTADWQIGDLQSLPREWGIITLPGGYAQSGTYTVTIGFTVHCTDKPSAVCLTGSNGCSTKVSVPVVVN
jgi:hypothetical protein